MDSERAPRHIILLSDGTGNSRGKRFTTNVWRVYQALDLADPAHPKTPRQFAFYDDGVGSSSFKPWALLGGALGVGLARNVRDLYAFLCRTYRPGDRIYAFGFSRGAFTIRVLVGLIVNQGIVPYDGDEARLERLVNAAYRAYRRRYTLRLNYIEPLRNLRDAVLAWWACKRGHEAYDDVEMIGAPNAPNPIEIEFLGLWDTVDAYGLPVDELMRGVDKVVWPLTMRDLKLSKQVRRAVHALALDDERNTFHPRLWREEAPAGAPARAADAPHCAHERISQVWFTGMHSDVGGGYADQGLSHVSLEWVISAATACRLRFVEDIRKQQRGLSDENGPMNDSRRGLAGYYRYNPRRLETLYAKARGARPKVHESVVRRIRAGQDAYAPIVLPPDFDVVNIDGSIKDGAALLGLVGPAKMAYAAGRERVFNLVWWRRVVYFATLGSTAVLLVLPLAAERGLGGCTSALCWLSPMIRALDFVLPAMLSGWTNWYATHPAHFAVLGGLVVAGLWLGGLLQQSIGDAMRRVWYVLDAARPVSLQPPPSGSAAGPIERVLQWMRTRRIYKKALRKMSRIVLPAGFLVGMVGVTAMLLNAAWFAIEASSGSVCKESPQAMAVGPLTRQKVFDTGQLCTATGMLLQAGGSYRIELAVGPAVSGQPGGWTDGGVEADLRGVRPGAVTWPMHLGTPMRREASQPWLMPMARIGGRGTDLYPLAPQPSVPFEPPLTVLHTCLVARSSGELFVYVNDAVGPPGMNDYFYRNNRGTATLSVSRIEPSTAAASSVSDGACEAP